MMCLVPSLTGTPPGTQCSPSRPCTHVRQMKELDLPSWCSKNLGEQWDPANSCCPADSKWMAHPAASPFMSQWPRPTVVLGAFLALPTPFSSRDTLFLWKELYTNSTAHTVRGPPLSFQKVACDIQHYQYRPLYTFQAIRMVLSPQRASISIYQNHESLMHAWAS